MFSPHPPPPLPRNPRFRAPFMAGPTHTEMSQPTPYSLPFSRFSTPQGGHPALFQVQPTQQNGQHRPTHSAHLEMFTSPKSPHASNQMRREGGARRCHVAAPAHRVSGPHYFSSWIRRRNTKRNSSPEVRKFRTNAPGRPTWAAGCDPICQTHPPENPLAGYCPRRRVSRAHKPPPRPVLRKEVLL